MGGRKSVSAGALGARVEEAGRSKALSAGMARKVERIMARGRLPQCWQPDDLQQSCFGTPG